LRLPNPGLSRDDCNSQGGANRRACKNLAHPSIRELDRPVKLTAENARLGLGRVADTLRAQYPYIALNPGTVSRLHIDRKLSRQ
jgi:hypothetical protein